MSEEATTYDVFPCACDLLDGPVLGKLENLVEHVKALVYLAFFDFLIHLRFLSLNIALALPDHLLRPRTNKDMRFYGRYCNLH
jgi:hypothetical protein